MTPRVPAHQHLWSRPIAGLALVAAAALLGACGSATTPVSSPSITASPTPAPPSITVPSATPSPPLQTYVVAKGDTFSKIARRFGVTVEELLAANPSLKNPNKISIGDGIVIPTPSAGSIETPTPDVTPEPTPAPSPSRRPSPPRSRRSPIDPGPLRVDGFADVLVTDLAIRSKPSVATDSKVLGRLTTGDRVFILKGPVEGSGFAWYQVAPRDWESGEKPVGWIAAGSRDGEPWLEGRTPDCPPLPVEVGTLAAMTSFERLSCFGSRDLTFNAGIGEWTDDFGPTHPWGTPDWLNPIGSGRSIGGLGDVAFAPGLELPGELPGDEESDLGYRVRGHFDDPASSTCRSGTVEWNDETNTETRHKDPAVESVLACRTRFVVTEVLGLHRVATGDTLSGIADVYGVTLAALLAANPQITDPSLIHPGDLLTIPGGGSTP